MSVSQKVLVLGLGASGRTAARFYASRGFEVLAADTRPQPPRLDELQKEIPNLKFLGGAVSPVIVAEVSEVMISPGLSPEYSVFAPAVKEAKHRGIAVVGEIELFARELKKLKAETGYAPKIIGITGTNGKTTTTMLSTAIIAEAGKSVVAAGNVGPNALGELEKHRQVGILPDFWVLELSSFQLETTSSLQAVAATILNVTEDHMDRYPFGLQQYRAAKLRIYENAKVCVVNADDALTMPIRGADERCVSFGVNMGDYHLNHQQGETWLRVKGEKVLNVKEMKLSGQHNYTNALAALALADAAGLPRASSLKALTTFTGLPHRFEVVLEHNGVRWVNDSKATNVGSTEAALNGLHVDGTLHLLLGGDGKSADFSPLARYLNGDNVRLYCFGRDGAQLAALRPEVAEQTETMEQAMRLLAPRVQPGDMVLLSPACASLDQFKNFEQRGNEFARLAKELG